MEKKTFLMIICTAELSEKPRKHLRDKIAKGPSVLRNSLTLSFFLGSLCTISSMLELARRRREEKGENNMGNFSSHSR